MSFNECSNTDIEKTFMLILRTAVANKLTQKDMPEIIYIISDMEFDWCAGNSSMTNFENAKKIFEERDFKTLQYVFDSSGICISQRCIHSLGFRHMFAQLEGKLF